MKKTKRRGGYKIGDITVTQYSFNAPVEAPVTFVFVSDLHSCENTRVTSLIREQSPDAILAGGDVIHHTYSYEQGYDFFRRCADIAPTFFSYGNHERHFTYDITPSIEACGVCVLDCTYTYFRGICIGGLPSAYGWGQRQYHLIKPPVPDTAFLEKFAAAEGYHVLLCHHPEYYEKYVRPLPVELTLAGHAHGGQWRVRGRGIFAPGQGFFPRYTSGIYDGRFIVSRGVGNPINIPRISNPPEIIKITLSPDKGHG